MELHHPLLVATDLSARSDRAIDRASFLAEAAKVRLFVCHVVESGSRLAGEADLADAAVRAVLPGTRAEIEILVSEGSAPHVIVDQAARNGCGMIVTGVARHNQIGDFFIGTAVDLIIREADVPVLIVKQRPRSSYRTILAATDFSPCSRYALLAAARLFPSAAIHLVHAFHVPFEGFLSVEQNQEAFETEAQQAFDDFLTGSGITPELRRRLTPHLRYGETQSVVQKVAREIGADLVVLGTHGRSGFSKAVFGSMAEAVLQSVLADTMVIRETA
ncbi:universal stress protein [Sphingobium olei]|uniref:Universal stress protein n=1 Tax=Sphingobium olei TaxID=420955 RepID=A0ABW3P0A8_9SPHN